MRITCEVYRCYCFAVCASGERFVCKMQPPSPSFENKTFWKSISKDLFLTVGSMGKSYGLCTGGETGTGDHNEPLFIKHVIRKAVLSQSTCSILSFLPLVPSTFFM